MLSYFAKLPPCKVGIEACGGSHYWARELVKAGHEVKLIAAKFVIPYQRKGKNDASDAEVSCEAISRPGIHFVAVKSEDQQTIRMAHRVRSHNVITRIALVNQPHTLLREFGIALSKGRHKLKQEFTELFEALELSPLRHELIHDLFAVLYLEEERIATLDTRITQWAQTDTVAKRPAKFDGIGPLTASAVVATTGNANVFLEHCLSNTKRNWIFFFHQTKSRHRNLIPYF